jgi:hypothetical protein
MARARESASASTAEVAESANVPQVATDDEGQPVTGKVTATQVGKAEPNEQAKVEVKGLTDQHGNELPTLTFDPERNDGVPTGADGIVPAWSLEGLARSLVVMAARDEDRAALIARAGPDRQD